MSELLEFHYGKIPPATVHAQKFNCSVCGWEGEISIMYNCPLDQTLATMTAARCGKCGASHEALRLGWKPKPVSAPVGPYDPKEEVKKWLKGHDTGLSSQCLAKDFLGHLPLIYYPHDGDDLGRCLRLIRQVPEVRASVDRLAERSDHWKALAGIWDDLEQCMEEECGIAWEKSERAPKTYKMMQKALSDD